MPKKSDYEITVELSSGDNYKATGKTVHEALDALGLNYTHIKSKGTLMLKHGGKTSSRMFYCRPLRRLVSNKLRKAQVGKDLVYLLK